MFLRLSVCAVLMDFDCLQVIYFNIGIWTDRRDKKENICAPGMLLGQFMQNRKNRFCRLDRKTGICYFKIQIIYGSNADDKLSDEKSTYAGMIQRSSVW